MNSILLFISGPEIMVVMLIVVMVFGADKIPEIQRVKKDIDDITGPIKRNL